MPTVRNERVRYPGGPRSLWGMAAMMVGTLVAIAVEATSWAVLLERTPVPAEGGGTTTLAAAFADSSVLPPLWRRVGWLLWGAHGVPTAVPTDAGTIVLRNLYVSAGGRYLLAMAVPPLALAFAGLLATRDFGGATSLRFDLGTGRQRYAVNGSLHALLGYFPFAFGGTILLPLGALGPDIVAGIALVVFGYPLLFGGLGGFVGSFLDWRRTPIAVRRSEAPTGRY